jgi:PAS domain S-box-containing protein
VQEQHNLANLALVQAGLAHQNTFKIYYDDALGGWFLGSVFATQSGWLAVSTQPVAVAARPLSTLAIVAVIAFCLSLITFILVQQQTARQITGPLSTLVHKADALANGRYESLSAYDLGPFTELVSLGQSFARMVAAVQERDQRLARQVTDLQRAEQETRRTQVFLNTIIENIPTAVFVKEAQELRYVLSNKAGEAMVGLPKEKIIGRTDFDLFSPEDAANFQIFDRQTLAGTTLLEIPEDSVQTPSMGLRITHTKKLPIFGKNGAPKFVLSIAHDITERKQAEEKLQQNNRELTLLNRVIAASAATIEPETILETVCRELALAFGVPQAAAALLNPQKTEAVVVAEFLPEGRTSALGQVLPVKNNPSAQYILTHKAPLAVEDTFNDPMLAPVRDILHARGIVSMLLVPLVIGGEVVGTLGLDALEPRHFSAGDINLAWSVADQVSGALARARLDKERRRLSAVLEQTAESVLITNPDGEIVYVNPAFERITGYSRTEVMGQTPHILQSGKQDAALYRELWNIIANGRVWQGRFINKAKNSRLYSTDATITPVFDEAGRIVNYVSVQRDITRELQLEEQYRQAQKMEAVGRLAAGIAHDFNNLLTAINGFAALLQYELAQNNPHRELADKILRSGQRAADLVRQLLTFSRRQVVEPRLINLNTLIADMQPMLRRVISEQIEFVVDLTPDLGVIRADPSHIEQVILNLVVNAGDAMPTGGRLTIKTAHVMLGEDYLAQHMEAEPGEHVMLAVSDTGVGIAEEVREHIFEPFFTTKEVGKGTGLGLATVFGVVKQCNGHVWVYSEPGQGAVFKVYLPRVAEHQPVGPSASEVKHLPHGDETVLLVEDESMVRELAARVLRNQGYTVIEAADGREALQTALQSPTPIHLLLTDIIMPHMNGKILAKELQAAFPEIKLLFTSGYSDNVVTRQGLVDAGYEFIEKPFSPAELAQKVRRVLDAPKFPVDGRAA